MDWIITHDFLTPQNERGCRIGHGKWRLGMVRPTDLPRDALAVIAQHVAGQSQYTHEFQLHDGDDCLCFKGRCTNIELASEGAAFAPLDWAEADVGATTMKVRRLGEQKWQVL